MKTEKRVTYLSTVIILMLFACTSDFNITDNTRQEGCSIGLLEYSILENEKATTRTSTTDLLNTTFLNGDLINVNVYKEGVLLNSGTYKAGTSTNGKNTLTAVTNAYWPSGVKNSSMTADIVGLYPSTVSASGDSFTVHEDQSSDSDYKGSDLMFAINTDAAKSSLQALKFSHKMAKVIVTVTCASGFTPVIQQINMINMYRSIGFNPQTGELDYGNINNIGTIVMQKGGTSTSMTAVALVPPQTIPISNKCIEIVTNSGTAYYNTAKTYYANTANSYQVPLTLETGKYYHFKLQLSQSDILQQYNIESWDSGEDDALLCYYNYTGNIQTFTVPRTATYRLRAWGAQGGSVSSLSGGYGGYAESNVALTAGQTLYIAVGGKGKDGTVGNQTLTGGWNGGGNAISNSNSIRCASGGGATHVALTTGLRSELRLDDVLVIAGGGGGASSSLAGGNGCAEMSGGYLAGNGEGQWATNQAGGGGGNQGGRNDVGSAFGGSGYTIDGSSSTSTRTGNGFLSISIVNY